MAQWSIYQLYLGYAAVHGYGGRDCERRQAEGATCGIARSSQDFLSTSQVVVANRCWLNTSWFGIALALAKTA